MQMAERTFVEVDEIDPFKLAEAEREKMAEVFSDIPDYCTVVFTYETVDWKPDRRQKKLWDAVNKFGSVVEFAKQSQRDLQSCPRLISPGLSFSMVLPSINQLA